MNMQTLLQKLPLFSPSNFNPYIVRGPHLKICRGLRSESTIPPGQSTGVPLAIGITSAGALSW